MRLKEEKVITPGEVVDVYITKYDIRKYEKGYVLSFILFSPEKSASIEKLCFWSSTQSKEYAQDFFRSFGFKKENGEWLLEDEHIIGKGAKIKTYIRKYTGSDGNEKRSIEVEVIEKIKDADMETVEEWKLKDESEEDENLPF